MASEAQGPGVEPLLSVVGLTVRYGILTGLRDATIKVYPGEFVTLIGANGADSADALVAMADRALYEAKARGKDQIVQFDVADRSAATL